MRQFIRGVCQIMDPFLRIMPRTNGAFITSQNTSVRTGEPKLPPNILDTFAIV